VILVDANLLVYAVVREAPQHDAARRWLEEQVDTCPRVGLPWASLLAFLRLVSNPRVCQVPVPILVAWRQVTDWLQLEPVWVPQPTARHAEVLGRLLGLTPRGGNPVADAHLAALAIEHGLVLCSADADFAAFHELRWLNPLRPAG
jgi:hypothetical protein